MHLRRSLRTARRFHRSRQGATTVEYAVMIAAMAAAAVVILTMFQVGMRTFTMAAGQRLAVSSDASSSGRSSGTSSGGTSATSQGGSNAGGNGNGGNGNAGGSNGSSGDNGGSDKHPTQ